MKALNQIQAIAAKRFQEIFSAKLFDEETKLIVIAQYQTADDFNEMKSEDEPFDFFEHRIYTTCFAKLASEAGVNIAIAFQTVKPAEYFGWLEENGFKDSQSHRAHFAAIKYNKLKENDE